MKLSIGQTFGIIAGFLGIGVLAGCSFGGCTTRRKKNSFSFQVDTNSELFAPAMEAAANWTRALHIPITVSADGEIPIFLTPNPECPLPEEYKGTGKVVMGCTMDVDKPGARIEMNVANLKVAPGVMLVNIMHEMGHILRGNYDHLDDPEDKCCIMAPADNPCKVAITQKDIDFICECLECPASSNA